MEITIESIDNLNSVIKLQIEKNDYETQVEKSLKINQKNARMPGFRPGKVPMGIIQKMYRKSVLVEELNKIISENLQKYITENNLNTLFEPLPRETKETLDLEYAENFEFEFDLALQPEFDVELNKSITTQFYHVTITDDMIEEEIDNLTDRFGHLEHIDNVGDDSIITCNLIQVDDLGNEVEDTLVFNDLMISMESITDQDAKNLFLGKTVDESVIIDIRKTFPNDTNLMYMLKISKEEIPTIIGNYKVVINEVSQYVKAEMNQSLFDQIFTPGTISSEEEMNSKIKEDLEKRYLLESTLLFQRGINDLLLSKIDFPLPEDFIMRWIKLNIKENEHFSEKDTKNFFEELKLKLIFAKIIKTNSLTVDENDINKYLEKLTRIQLLSYKISHITDEMVRHYSVNMMKNEESAEKLSYGAMFEKITEHIKDSITLENIEISRDDFLKKV